MLRAYQNTAIDMIEDSFKVNDRILLNMATGAGKSRLFSHIVKEKVKERPIVLVVRGRDLVNQASLNLSKLEIDHSVFMRGHWRFDRTSPVQVCSLDTVYSRKAYPFEKESPLVICDEAHMVNMMAAKYGEFFKRYAHTKILGLTGSPYPYSDVFQEVIDVISPTELREQGFLSPVRIYIPSAINISGVKIKKGEYDKTQLEAACSTNTVLGDIVESYQKYGENRRGIIFSVSISHAILICDRLNEAGISAGQINSDEHSSTNEKVVKDFKEGKIKLLVNVNMASVGVDYPFVELLLLARPTLSVNLHVQQLGRCLRPSPGKADAVILDLAANCLRHGGPYTPRIAFPSNTKNGVKKVTMHTCENCFRVSEKKTIPCEYCGFISEKKDKHKNLAYLDSELQLLEVNQEQEKLATFINEFKKLEKTKINRRIYIPSWSYQQMLKKFGLEMCRKFGQHIQFPLLLLKD